MQRSKLKTAQMLATIFATVAVPIVVAFASWQIQKTISADSLKKDYVQMAANILSQPSTEKNQQLRAWAIEILNKNSSVPMTPAVASEMSQIVIIPSQQWVSALKGSKLLDPPLPPIEMEKGKLSSVIENYGENTYRCKVNAATLSGLQSLIKSWIEQDAKEQSKAVGSTSGT